MCVSRIDHVVHDGDVSIVRFGCKAHVTFPGVQGGGPGKWDCICAAVRRDHVWYGMVWWSPAPHAAPSTGERETTAFTQVGCSLPHGEQ
jgi:hypothetical protein